MGDPIILATCPCGWKPPKDLKVYAIGVVERVTFHCPECGCLLEKSPEGVDDEQKTLS